jgi:hypothetical protein
MKKSQLLFITVLCIVFLLIFIISTKKNNNTENYADQVAHGIVGGISGPLIDLGTFSNPYPYPHNESEKEPYFFLLNERPYITESFEGIHLKNRGTELVNSKYFGVGRDFIEKGNPPIPTNSGCSFICPHGYPKECPMGAKGCPYSCTGL